MLLFRLFTFENCGLVQMMQQILGPIADGVAGTPLILAAKVFFTSEITKYNTVMQVNNQKV